MKKISVWFSGSRRNDSAIVPRPNHTLSRKKISSSALKVLYRLHNKGFSAYLVGGGVRDLLLKRESKDFDVVTDATPEEVRELFSNSRIIGRRFKIVHVVFQEEIIEVSTFRAQEQDHRGRSSRIRYENTFGSLEEDVWRRDFTVNALYYNISDYSILDYVGGMDDLRDGVIRMLGDPAERFNEDPVRLLRALRFAAKLNFSMETKMEEEVRRLPDLLYRVPASRLLHEFEKLFFAGFACKMFSALQSYGYLSLLLPEVDVLMKKTQSAITDRLILLGLENTDSRYKQGKSLNPAFLFGVLLWPVLMKTLRVQQESHTRFFNALHAAIQQTISQQQTIIQIPKRYASMIRSMWVMQFSLEKRRPKRVLPLSQHRYFRAAMDLLELRAESGEDILSLAQWWRQVEKSDVSEVKEMIKQSLKDSSGR